MPTYIPTTYYYAHFNKTATIIIFIILLRYKYNTNCMRMKNLQNWIAVLLVVRGRARGLANCVEF